MDPALWEVLKSESVDGAEEVEAIIRLDDPRAKIAGVRIVTRFGPIATCRLRKESILETRAEENVRSLKAPRLLGPELEPEGLNARLRLPPAVVPSDVRRPPGLSLTGAGVVIGIIDWGCDFDHPQFKHPDGSTRLLALWDQRGSPPPQARSYYGYGTVHSNRRINRALASAKPYRVLGYHPADADSDGHGAHGTHVMDIAAGNGLGRGPMGVAPKADLIFVHLADRGTGGLANLGDSVRILEALDFVAKVAWPRPWVVNFSVGRHGGPHDGTTLAEMAFDFALQDASNCFLVQSTGNYSGKNIHSSGRLQTGQTRTLSLIVDEADTTPNELEIWYSGGDEFAVRTESPNGVISRWVKLGEQAEVLENGRMVGRIYHRAADPNNSDNHLDLFLYVSAPPGVWKVTLRAERISSGGVFHTWLERDEACPGCQTRFSKFDSDNFYTTGTLANSHIPLVVGAYNAHSQVREVTAFSSVGPTRDRRPKPDLCAPGQGVLAARSSPRGASKSTGMFVRKSGTSMAAPHVTGAVALCLQGTRRPLWSHEIRELILNNTTPAPASGRHALRYGRGYLDVGRVVEAVLALPPRRKTAPVYSYAASEEHPSRLKESTMNGRHDEYLDRLEQVVKGSTSRAASERNLLAEILRASRLPLDFNSIDPDKLYQMLAFNRNGALPAKIGESFTVLARPGEAPTGSPQAGDVLLRVALGEPGLGHLAVISDPTLWSYKQLANAPFQPESQQPGFYATVIEGGAFPHTYSDRFARRILDGSGRVPADQMILRIRPQVDGEDENVFEAAPGMATLGTWIAAQRTAPIFNNGPQIDLLGELENEIILYELAKIILRGLKNLSSKKAGYPNLLFLEKQKQEQLFTDIQQEMTKTISRIDKDHKTDAWGQFVKGEENKKIFSPATTIKISSSQDLIPILKLLIYHEIIRPLKMPDGSDCYYFKENTTLGDNTLDAIKQMTKNFRKTFVDDRLRIKAGERIRPSYHKPTFETESLPKEISASGPPIFAKSVVAFLKELQNECLCRYNCPKWKADNYPVHSWGEFSVDIYLWIVKEQTGSYKGFYKENPTKVFMDALNAVAEAGVTPYGKFAWKVIYNDPRIRAYVQKQYGDGRINKKPIEDHGPEKIHIHLDVRPVVLYKTSKDEEIAGYRVNNQGRIELINISAADDSNAKKLQALSRVDAIQLQDTEAGGGIQEEYFSEQAAAPYGGYDLQRGDNDTDKKYGGVIQTGPAQNYVRQLQDDLRELGYGIVGNSDGDFGFNTECGVREFQIYAKMDHIALEIRHSNAANYVDRLRGAANTDKYTQPVNGYANAETRRLIQLWKQNRWRCPVVIQAWNVDTNGNRTTIFNGRQNIWKHDEVTSSAPRMFARDFSSYYTLPQGRSQNDYIVLGDYPMGNKTGKGPESRPSPGHTWNEAEITPETLLGKPLANLNNAERSTFKVIRAVSETECEGFFDGINAWDNAFVSMGPFHWVLGLFSTKADKDDIDGGSLAGFLSFLKAREGAGRHSAYSKAFGFFGGGVDRDWSGDGSNIYLNDLGTYSRARVALLQKDGTYKAMPNKKSAGGVTFGNYFRSWHWFYRFLMAARTIQGFRLDFWLITRAQLQGILSRPFNVAFFRSGGANPPTLGQVFTSERAVALLTRWHARYPAHLILNSRLDRLTQVFNTALENMRRARLTNLNNPAQWTNDHEAHLIQAIMDTARNHGGPDRTTMNTVYNFPDWLQRNPRHFTLDRTIGNLSVHRNSFVMDVSNLPPMP